MQVATTLGNLANVLRQMGDYDQAKALYERALAVQQNHYGQDHVEVARTLGNLAGVLHQMGDYDQAKALYERALAVQQITTAKTMWKWPQHLAI